MCARYGDGSPLSDAHITEWEVSRSNHHHNLLRLCNNCHGLYDNKTITRIVPWWRPLQTGTMYS